MAIHLWDGSSWRPALSVQVWNGSTFVAAKKRHVWNGSAWVLAWVPPVTAATLTLSKSGVAASETYSVSLNVPSGFPEGSVVTFRYNDTTHTMAPAEGSTTITKTGVSHTTSGSVHWYADVETKGGNSTFGPTTQTVVTSSGGTVTTATLSLSKTGVVTGEVYNVTLTVPAGYPAGTTVRFYHSGGSVDVAAVTAATTCTAVGVSHATGSTVAWYANAITPAGTTTFGPLTQTVTAPAAPRSQVPLNGGHCHDIIDAMAVAVSEGVPLRLTGTFHIYTNVLIPSNLHVIATGAHFYVNKHTDGSYNAGRFRNATNGSAPGYGQAGNFVWDGGTFDGNGDGIWTISHSPGFTIKNAIFYRYCSTANIGHAIETNSSGGADNVTGAYTVQITGNTFLGTDMGQRANSNDEPVHFDWNWDGSGASAPVWNVGDPISESTQVMCHNMLVSGNTFSRYAETGGWEFAKCAIGGHDPGSGLVPTYRHNHFLFSNNTIHGATGGTIPNPDKGAIHMFRVRQCIAQGNALYGGVANRFITAENATDATYCSANSNVAQSPTLSSPNSIVVKNT